MFRRTAICWLTTLTLCVVAIGTLSLLVAPVASASTTERSAVSVAVVPAQQVNSGVASDGLGYCCTGDHSTRTAGSVPLLAPWGPAPVTANSTAIEWYLFNLINHDRATRGLYLYSWNPTLAYGARLHSWNMAHCGFSHSCPDGDYQFGCMRITGEFPNNTDCGECISASWSNGTLASQEQAIGSIQEGMVNEPDSPSSWHRIHLTSQTLHSIGVGVYVAPNGWIYATEDMVS
jgi:uncharacterized protein YkwD